jgi:urea transport system substrate-binding protein
MNAADSQLPTSHGFARGPDPARHTPRPGGWYPFLAPAEATDELGRFDEYRVLRLIGTGGTGLVFAAEDPQLGRAVALKVLKPELAVAPDARERFLREARAAAGLDSDHVVSILRVAECGGYPFIVMPLLAGETLQARLERAAPLDLRTALTAARDTARGLVAAHAAGLIHRDIKPANVWLETDGAGGPLKRARILDFGLARRAHAEASLTSTGFVVGTPHYMSPEQAAGEAFDHRTDLFSLGCVLYAALAGEQPFPGNSAMAVMMALANKTPAPVSQKNRAVPRAVSDLVDALLAKKPERRVQTAAEVVNLLDAALAGSPLPPRVPVPIPDADTRVSAVGDTDSPGTAAPRRARLSRRAALVALAGAPVAGVGAWFAARERGAPVVAPPVPPAEPIVVGVLHSQSGTMAVSENAVIDATLLAIDELNAAGGVLGRPVRPAVLDGGSNPEQFAKQAERLFAEGLTAAAFGCWTSASRKAVRPVVERYGGVLFYPVQYEGLEESPRIVYLGPAPNQQLIPAVDYAIDVLNKKRVALVGSDYVFPRTAHAIIRDHLQKRRERGAHVEFVGEDLIPLGSDNVLPTVERVRRVETDLVINTINGSTNGHFYAALRDPAREWKKPVTTISVSITENEVRGLNPRNLTDDYIVASYFDSLDRAESRAFISRIQAKYGTDRATTDMMAAAYAGVHFWAKAAARARSAEPNAVLAAVRGIEFDGPRGREKIDPANLHAWLPVRVGKVQPDGEVKIVGGSDEPVKPVPFPNTRTRAEWDHFLRDLHMRWGGRWQAPEK